MSENPPTRVCRECGHFIPATKACPGTYEPRNGTVVCMECHYKLDNGSEV